MTKGLNVPSVTLKQMREVDRPMIEKYGILLIQMMENAGRSLATLVSTIAQGVSGKLEQSCSLSFAFVAIFRWRRIGEDSGGSLPQRPTASWRGENRR